MSDSEDVALIREAYRVWNEGGISTASASRFMHPDIEWTTPPEVPGGGHFVGREATMAYLRDWEGTMGVLNLSFTIQEIIPVPGEYLVVSQAEGTSESGIAIPAHNWFHLMRLKHGTIWRATLFLDRSQALEAAGLRG